MDEQEFKKAFGRRIKKLRQDQNLTQEKLSELVWIDPQHFCKIENGSHFPTVKNLLKLAEVFNIDVKDMFSFDNLPKDDEILTINSELRKLDTCELNYLYTVIKAFIGLKKRKVRRRPEYSGS